MVDNIDQLPDDILSYIFSFLSVRDAFRARASSIRWLHLLDSRCVLQFDSLNIFGKRISYEDRPVVQSKFVKIVDCFMETWAGERINKLVVKFLLRQEHASHIDRWIATSVGMKVEEIELDFWGISKEKYAFPSHLIHFGKVPCLRRLCLQGCTLSISFECASLVRNLTTLDLNSVPLHETGMDLILSAGSNLISLGLYNCCLPKYTWINGQLLHLKKLIIRDSLIEVKLNCPNLEVFEYEGCERLTTFVHVPILRKAKLWSTLKPRWFDHVTRQVPHLRALSLRIVTEVQPRMSTFARSGLKQLEIYVPFAFDLLSITRLLNACPFLEILQLKMFWRRSVVTIKKGEYQDRHHFKLKEFKIGRFYDQWNELELAIYLLKNAVALEQMVIEVPRDDDRLREKAMSLQQLQKNTNPAAKLIVI